MDIDSVINGMIAGESIVLDLTQIQRETLSRVLNSGWPGEAALALQLTHGEKLAVLAVRIPTMEHGDMWATLADDIPVTVVEQRGYQGGPA